MGKVLKHNPQLQFQANSKFAGTCNRLSTTTKPTLVITGTEGMISPPVNSFRTAKNPWSMVCGDKSRRTWCYVPIS